MTHEEIQILISAYIDGEIMPSEKNIVEEHLSTCPLCQKDYKSYKAMSSSLSKWSNEDLSPDEEIKMQKRFEQRREPMFTKRSATIFVTTLCLTLVIGSVLQVPLKRGVQVRLKSASDDIGDQYSHGRGGRGVQSAQYESYYLASTYPSVSFKDDKKRLASRSVGAVAKSYSARSGMENVAMTGMDAAPALVQDAVTSSYYQNSNGYYAADEARKKIQKAEISLLVDNAFKVKSQLTDLILQFNGIIESSEFNRSMDGAGGGSMVCKVYPKDLEHALQQIRKLGEVDEENESSADVTDQYNDAQENIVKYTSDKDRLQKSLNNFKLFNPTTDAEKENAQRQITQTQEEIKALERVIKFYQEQTSMSIIIVKYHDNFKTAVHQNDPSNQWKAVFDNKWTLTKNASIEVFTNILFGIIYLLSYIVPVLVWCAIFGIIYFIISMFFKK
ncbi:MAG: DUF4349 domain-containing protein [Candidatus Omnitrophica bacterium]|nr:DUF4349 domain-containing protein [Candidatus Omnitrophota bacterium]